MLYGWKNLKLYQFCAARLHVESCALSNKKTLLMKISLLLTELAHFLDAPQCDYHTINCQVSKIGLIESTNGWKFFESTKNISPSSPLVHLSGVMLACVSACNRSMNCLPWLDFLRLHFVTVIQALKSTNRIDSVTMDTDECTHEVAFEIKREWNRVNALERLLDSNLFIYLKSKT